jgi:hypothetical protein
MGRVRLGGGRGEKAGAGQAAGRRDTARVPEEIPPARGLAIVMVVTGH